VALNRFTTISSSFCIPAELSVPTGRKFMRSTILFLLPFFCVTTSLVCGAVNDAQAASSRLKAGTYVLGGEDLVALEEVVCGLINQEWQPGNLLRSGAFVPYSTKVNQIRRESRKVRGKSKLSKRKQKTLKRTLANVQKSLQDGVVLCAMAFEVPVEPTVVPTPVPELVPPPVDPELPIAPVAIPPASILPIPSINIPTVIPLTPSVLPGSDTVGPYSFPIGGIPSLTFGSSS